MDIALQSAFVAEASALLILLAVAIFLYLSFREKYLAPWIGGWIGYSFSKLFMAISILYPRSWGWVALAYALLPVAAALFATAVFLYVEDKRWLLRAWGLAAMAVLFGVTMAAHFPDSRLFAWVFWVGWSLILWSAAWRLAVFARSRGNVGLWILAGMLFFVHVDSRSNWHTLHNLDILLDLLLGISMMMFMIGLELSLERLRVMRRLVVGFGLLLYRVINRV